MLQHRFSSITTRPFLGVGDHFWDQNVATASIHPCQRNLKLCAEMVAGIAATHANAVDREARFPTEVFAAARAERLLSLLVPVELGGRGASVSDVVDVCYALARARASSGMVFAIHQIMVGAPRPRQRLASADAAALECGAAAAGFIDHGRHRRR
jgi:alkylation response protein AidB-like acyl-CoA dehydrogenase